VLGEVLAEFPGKVRLVYKDFPLSFHAGAGPAAVAARCAGEGGLFWEYHDLLFVSQPAFARADLLTYAKRLGLSPDSFANCLDSDRFREAVKSDVQEGRSMGVSGTPTFFINGRRLVGAQPSSRFRDAIEDALRQSEPKGP
jgi:protein-disulfide isomerase